MKVESELVIHTEDDQDSSNIFSDLSCYFIQSLVILYSQFP